MTQSAIILKALSTGEPVSTDDLVDALWPRASRQPPYAHKTVHVLIHHLRKDHRITTTLPNGRRSSGLYQMVAA